MDDYDSVRVGNGQQLTIGNRLRETRRRAHLTQADLAAAAGLSVETVSRIEGGRFAPSFSTATSLARALGIGIEILAGTSARPGPRPAPADPLAASIRRLSPDVKRAVSLLVSRLVRRRPRRRR